MTLRFEKPTPYSTGALILRKDNLAGLLENDDAIEITVKLEIK